MATSVPPGPETVNRTVAGPEVVYSWVGFWSELEAPSPNSHRQEVIAPLEVSLNWTVKGALPPETSREKAATGGGTGVDVGVGVGLGVGVGVGLGVGLDTGVSVGDGVGDGRGVGAMDEPTMEVGAGSVVGTELDVGSPPLVHAAKASTPMARRKSHFGPWTLTMLVVYVRARLMATIAPVSLAA